MADIDINVLLQSYEAEIGRLNGDLIKQRVAYEAQIKELTDSFVSSKENEVVLEEGKE